MAKKIYFSPSDQTRNTYAAGNTNEAEQCRKIAQACVKAAERCGLEAKTNTSASMEDRVTESDAFGADLHVPIHTNAFNGQVSGTRIFCYSMDGDGRRACDCIMNALAPITPGSSDSVTAYPTLYEVRVPKAYTAYVEVAFHDNQTEAAWIIAHTEDIAEAIVKGVCAYFGVTYKAPEQTAPTAPSSSDVLYRVQIGAFSVRKNAEAMLEKAKAAGFSDAYIVSVKR